MAENKYIRFDWAVKRMLRDKANFDVLEGLITVLLEEEVHIVELLESEGNQETADDKFNRVDIKAKNSKGEIIIVEVQLTREAYYLERILYGVAKSITEHISLGDKYNEVKKVYSISILYFDLGKGSDYLYHGRTVFRGVHTGDTLEITTNERSIIQMKTPDKIFPEYYLIRVNEFDKVATTPLEEWLEYLRSGNIKENTTTPGLQQAREKLRMMQMSDAERHAYVHHMENIMAEDSFITAAHREGHHDGLMEGLKEGLEKGIEKGRAVGHEEGLKEGLKEGLEEGLEKGRAEERIQIARTLKASNVPVEVIKISTNLSEAEIEAL